MRHAILFPFLLISLLTGCASVQDSRGSELRVHDAIEQREQEWAEAMRQRDMERLETILAAEYRLTFADIDNLDFIPEGQPPYTPRHIWLRNTAGMSFGEITISDLRVRRLGDRFASAVFRMSLDDWAHGDRAIGSDYEVVDLWVYRDGRWQAVNRSSTPLD